MCHDLSSVPGTHVTNRKKRTDSWKLSLDPNMWCSNFLRDWKIETFHPAGNLKSEDKQFKIAQEGPEMDQTH